MKELSRELCLPEQGHQSWARGNRTSTPPDCHRECHRVTSRRHRVQRVWKRPQLATGAELNTGVACTDLGHFKYISPGQEFPAWCRPESFCCQFHPISAVELWSWKKILENWNCQLWHLFSKTVVIALAASSAGALHLLMCRWDMRELRQIQRLGNSHRIPNLRVLWFQSLFWLRDDSPSRRVKESNGRRLKRCSPTGWETSVRLPSSRSTSRERESESKQKPWSVRINSRHSIQWLRCSSNCFWTSEHMPLAFSHDNWEKSWAAPLDAVYQKWDVPWTLWPIACPVALVTARISKNPWIDRISFQEEAVGCVPRPRCSQPLTNFDDSRIVVITCQLTCHYMSMDTFLLFLNSFAKVQALEQSEGDRSARAQPFLPRTRQAWRCQLRNDSCAMPCFMEHELRRNPEAKISEKWKPKTNRTGQLLNSCRMWGKEMKTRKLWEPVRRNSSKVTKLLVQGIK